MAEAPQKKKLKLTTALREAIGAHSQKQEENVEKPVALALISDEKSAQDILNRIQAARRPQVILEATFNVCQQKKSDAHVGEAFLSIFRKHFSVLGIDSALSCWKLIEDNLTSSESSNEIAIAKAFIESANLLGHGFVKLLQIIRSGMPSVIKNAWKHNRRADSISIAYSFATLIIAENSYSLSDSKSLTEYWNQEVLTEKSMIKDFGMRMIASLVYSEDRPESLSSFSTIEPDQLELLSNIYFNHIEFFSGKLNKSICVELLAKSIEKHSEKNELVCLLNRLSSAEISISPILYRALISMLRSSFSFSESDIIALEDLETISLKEITKQLHNFLPSKSHQTSPKSVEKAKRMLDFIEEHICSCGDERYAAAYFLLVLNVCSLFNSSELWKKCERVATKLSEGAVEKLWKAGKKIDAAEDSTKEAIRIIREEAQVRAESHSNKFVNRTGAEVVEKLESSDVPVSEAIFLLEGVHTADVRKQVFDSVVKYVEELPGGESLNELKLYSLLIEMYGGSPLEPLTLQLIFSRIAADGWSEMTKTPGTEQSESSWFPVVESLIQLLDAVMKFAKNSVLKSLTAVFCQLLSQVLKNTQRFLKNSSNAVNSKTLTHEIETQFVLQRHKLIQDIARLIDAMKRNESYFAMLTASIIGDAVYHGSDSLLPMFRLHSLADKNASGLLATNLPVVERTRYKKFLSTITRASKKVY